MTRWVETERGIVGLEDCDANRHMTVTAYFAKFGQASAYLVALAGLYYNDLVERGYGLGTVVNTLRYRRELVDGDRYVIESAYVRLGNSSTRQVHKMIDLATGELAASSDSVEALFDFKTRKATPLTAEMRAGVKSLMVELSDADRAWFDGGR
jgi:acyl-CoA thioester hydrolase